MPGGETTKQPLSHAPTPQPPWHPPFQQLVASELRTIPVVFDGVVGAAGQELGDLGPLVAQLGVLGNDGLLLRLVVDCGVVRLELPGQRPRRCACLHTACPASTAFACWESHESCDLCGASSSACRPPATSRPPSMPQQQQQPLLHTTHGSRQPAQLSMFRPGQAHLFKGKGFLLERGVQLVEPAKPAALAVAPAAQALQGVRRTGAGRRSASLDAGMLLLRRCRRGCKLWKSFGSSLCIHGQREEAQPPRTHAAMLAGQTAAQPNSAPPAPASPATAPRTLAMRLQFCGPYVCSIHRRGGAGQAGGPCIACAVHKRRAISRNCLHWWAPRSPTRTRARSRQETHLHELDQLDILLCR